MESPISPSITDSDKKAHLMADVLKKSFSSSELSEIVRRISHSLHKSVSKIDKSNFDFDNIKGYDTLTSNVYPKNTSDNELPNEVSENTLDTLNSDLSDKEERYQLARDFKIKLVLIIATASFTIFGIYITSFIYFTKF